MAKAFILGGTSEAAALAHAATEQGVAVISSLAGRTRNPKQPAGAVRSGGFGGVDGLIAALRSQSAAAVVDATHPFAQRISANAVIACQRLGLPRLALIRPPWRARLGDRWIEVDDMPAAAGALAKLPAARRVLITTGQSQLGWFSALERYFLLRVIETPLPPPPLLNYAIVRARGPFSVADEIRLLRQNNIDIIISKNSGGSATSAKLTAARQLRLPLLMIRRPPPPPGPQVASVAAALDWLQQQIETTVR